MVSAATPDEQHHVAHHVAQPQPHPATASGRGQRIDGEVGVSEPAETGPAGTPTADPAGLGQGLAVAARDIVLDTDPAGKVARAKAVARAWQEGRLGPGHVSRPLAMPERPGRPVRPQLLHPKAMPKRSTAGDKGRFALLHALAHIELNAVDMSWDLIARFAHVPSPKAFLDDWVQVGLEEAEHFALVSRRLGELGGAYGDLPAHDGLWQAAQATGHDLLARLAVAPRGRRPKQGPPAAQR